MRRKEVLNQVLLCAEGRVQGQCAVPGNTQSRASRHAQETTSTQDPSGPAPEWPSSHRLCG
jgi:hypothetical protein